VRDGVRPETFAAMRRHTACFLAVTFCSSRMFRFDSAARTPSMSAERIHVVDHGTVLAFVCRYE